MFEDIYSKNEILDVGKTKCADVKNLNMDKFYRFITSSEIKRLEIKAVIMPNNFQFNEAACCRIPFKNVFPNCEAVYWPNINVVPPTFFRQSKVKTVIMNSCERILDNAFEESSIESITIPKNCFCIASEAFAGCKNLTTVDFSDARISLGASAFKRCVLLKKIKGANGLQGLGAEAFADTALSTVILPESIIYMGIGVFIGCRKLKKVTFKSDTQTIPPEMFRYCESLKEVNLNQNTVSIGNNVFELCTNLKKVTGLNNIKTIGYGAFMYSGITEYIAPKTLRRLEKSAFAGCKKLKTVDLSAAIDLSVIPEKTFFETDIESMVLPESLEKIEGCAFLSSHIKSITIPDSVRKIEEMAFKDCLYLKFVHWPNSCTEIKEETFSITPALDNIENLDNITKIGKNAFSKSSPNLNLRLPNLRGLGKIQFSDFKGTVDLTENPHLNGDMNVLKGNVDDKFACHLKLPYYI